MIEFLSYMEQIKILSTIAVSIANPIMMYGIVRVSSTSSRTVRNSPCELNEQQNQASSYTNRPEKHVEARIVCLWSNDLKHELSVFGAMTFHAQLLRRSILICLVCCLCLPSFEFGGIWHFNEIGAIIHRSRVLQGKTTLPLHYL